MKWRLGIDLGTNSLGWAAINLSLEDGYYSPSGILGAGVRIFSDGRNPKDKQSNAAQRREPRSARKNRDRYLRRRTKLLRELKDFDLLPLDAASNNEHIQKDPWILRYQALHERLELHEIGRAIFHLHQRRGFKSNRKTDRTDNEKGKVHEATKRTLIKLEQENAQTLGELFGKRRFDTAQTNSNTIEGKRSPQPSARVRKLGEGSKWQYDYYPTRDLILDEFDKIWNVQSRFHPTTLTDNARTIIRDTIEWQHRLVPPSVGRCTLLPDQERAAKALPSSQLARILQEVNALRYSYPGEKLHTLTIEQRDSLVKRLNTPSNQTAKLTFKQIRKLLDLSDRITFNVESEKRDHLVGNQTAASLSQAGRWGTTWFKLPLASQDQIIDTLLEEEQETKLFTYLKHNFKLSDETIRNVADAPLQSGYGNLSKSALDSIIPELEKDNIVYSEAVRRAGLGSHSNFETGEVFDTHLPYYGKILQRHVGFGSGNITDIDEKRYGKVANPTVHVALNQIRAVLNDLLKRFGPPEEITVELARDLALSAQGKKDLEKQQKENQEANDKRRAKLLELGIPDHYNNRMRLRLFEDLNALGKRCVFSGNQISLDMLFTEEVEIEHILPFSKTFDDSYANKTLATRQANRDKGNCSPFQAFGHSPSPYKWDEIAKRAAELPVNKRWRFRPDAMEKFSTNGGFLARQLTDTQYISRLARDYLTHIYPGDNSKNVRVIPGRLTADLRWQWGLDSVLHGHNIEPSEAKIKNRHDHRHHAIDAVVVACTDTRLLQLASKHAKQNEDQFNFKLMTGTPAPWEGFREDVAESIRSIIVSHKPDHGVQGALHNDTAYGLPKGEAGQPDKKGRRTVVTRKPISTFEKTADLEKIRDPFLKSIFLSATRGLTGSDFKLALAEVGKSLTPPVYKVRIEEKLTVIPIKDKAGQNYKAYKGDGNYCYDIWVDESGKWTGEIISTFDANQRSRTNPHWWKKPTRENGNPILMRLRKSDAVKMNYAGKTAIFNVCKFTHGRIYFAEHFEANVDARVRQKELKEIVLAPSSLQKSNATLVKVSPCGLD